MTNTNTTAPQDQQTTESDNTQNSASLVSELRAFGTQIEAVARAFLASNQAQQIQQELQRGVGELVERLQTVRSDERVVEVTEKGKQAVERALTNPAVIDAHAKVVQGLANINDELRKLATSLENDRNDNKPSA
ncbi:MAG: hypothetical protein RL076_131 [Chloroflexota bacterium]|jgi:DNA-binding protein YbaB